MASNPVSLQSARSNAAVRMADGLLRAMGGVPMFLRLPTPIVTPGNNGELGLGAPIYQDVTLDAVVVRDISTAKQQKFELLISASVVTKQMELQSVGSADALFASALGFLHGDDLLQIESVLTDEFAGAAYLYRITAVNSQAELQSSA